MVNKENYEEYMLLYADGELSEAEIKALLAFVDANPELRSELDAYNATSLVPDTTMVYAHKEELMKSSGGGKTIGLGKWWMYAAAACVILFAVMIIRNNDTNTADSTSVAITQIPKNKLQKPNETDTPKEIHSTPASPVVHENAIASKETRNPKKQNLNTKSKTTNPKSPSTDFLTKAEQPQQPEAQHLPVQSQHEEPAPIAKTATQPQHLPVIEQPSANEAITIQEVKEKKGILAWLPVNKEKTEGLNVIAEAVNEKIEKLKEVKNNIKDSEVKFRIGNKELFIVRL
jgi:hypothetical protein